MNNLGKGNTLPKSKKCGPNSESCDSNFAALSVSQQLPGKEIEAKDKFCRMTERRSPHTISDAHCNLTVASESSVADKHISLCKSTSANNDSKCGDAIETQTSSSKISARRARAKEEERANEIAVQRWKLANAKIQNQEIELQKCLDSEDTDRPKHRNRFDNDNEPILEECSNSDAMNLPWLNVPGIDDFSDDEFDGISSTSQDDINLSASEQSLTIRSLLDKFDFEENGSTSDARERPGIDNPIPPFKD